MVVLFVAVMKIVVVDVECLELCSAILKPKKSRLFAAFDCTEGELLSVEDSLS